MSSEGSAHEIVQKQNTNFVCSTLVFAICKKNFDSRKKRTKIAVASNVFHSKLSQRGVASPHAVCDESQQTTGARISSEASTQN